MQTSNLTQRKQLFNLKTIDSQILRDLVDFYKTPLTKAVTILNKKYKMTYQQLADEVFDGQIRRQAVQQNYTIKEESK